MTCLKTTLLWSLERAFRTLSSRPRETIASGKLLAKENKMTNVSYVLSYGNRADNTRIAKERLASHSGKDVYSYTHEGLDELAKALIISSNGGPAFVLSREELDFMAVMTGCGVFGPEAIMTDESIVYPEYSLSSRQSLYAGMLSHRLWEMKL